ncbi:hypothetical protein [Vibrio crassostreae]|uniref:Uncharacterized protein n=2 Tax=Vibrionaceae TaxID=641 RepID=A0A822N4Q9_9VIBR|nr:MULTISPECIES: hypothetical protein [Vibrio]MDH5949908.1 hypothetical protein [Vibrio crassostreae]TCN08469.1 hypothetical protein EDB35_107222 [Vibrio crassostreae]TCN93845.1 hypothetical protein EDB30_13119 [Vibrio crassostreae]TCT55369.1 hypothetical protein EDB42_102451 [Vibrio crassostreae]TCT79600.1 hypothetical protein EDB41_102451 [Vibrio crassostreae]
MSETGMKAILMSLTDLAGLKKVGTSVMATIVSFGVNDIAQLVAVTVGIISGCMAIRHYAVATQLNKAKLARLKSDHGTQMESEESS